MSVGVRVRGGRLPLHLLIVEPNLLRDSRLGDPYRDDLDARSPPVDV